MVTAMVGASVIGSREDEKGLADDGVWGTDEDEEEEGPEGGYDALLVNPFGVKP